MRAAWVIAWLPAAAEMEVTLQEAMPGPLLPPCENQEIPLAEAPGVVSGNFDVNSWRPKSVFHP